MTRTSIFLILFGLLIYSCSNPKTADNTSDKIGFTNNKTDLDKLNEILTSHDDVSQKIIIPSDKSTIVTGQRGTKIFINPKDLETQDGQSFGKNIEVELKELTNTGELLRANAQTISNDSILVSGGAYYIAITSNGEQLRLKNGMSLKVQFPKLSNNEMTLFYGQRDNLGRMNWQKSNKKFEQNVESARAKLGIALMPQPTRSTRLEYSEGNFNQKEHAEEDDSTISPEVKVRNYKDRKIAQKVYDETELTKLGWINCDRFLETELKTDLYVSFSPNDSLKYANVYLIFKDINSVIQADFYSDESPQFDNLPIGYKTKLIAYTVKNEKILAYSKDLTISKGQKMNLDLREMSSTEFKKLIRNE